LRREWKSEWVMDGEGSESESTEGRSRKRQVTHRLGWGWWRELRSWFQRQGDAYRKERSVICNEPKRGWYWWSSDSDGRWRASAARRLNIRDVIETVGVCCRAKKAMRKIHRKTPFLGENSKVCLAGHQYINSVPISTTSKDALYTCMTVTVRDVASQSLLYNARHSHANPTSSSYSATIRSLSDWNFVAYYGRPTTIIFSSCRLFFFLLLLFFLA